MLQWLIRHGYIKTTHTHGQTISCISPHTPARWLVGRDVRLGLGLEAQGVQAWPRGARRERSRPSAHACARGSAT